MAEVNLKNVKKSFGPVDVIKGVDLTIPDGDFCVFVGPSGCGKSTLLRMIAGLEETTSGSIQIGGKEMVDVDPANRGVAMVFQSYALYPHMTVAENITFGMRMAKRPKEEMDAKLARASKMLKLDTMLQRKPSQLSGGQRQRVAIGRAIVREPDVFLFDEPLSNLDAALRVEMRTEISKLHADLGATMIYVTHDQVEAMTMADIIVVLNAGKIEQVGSPLELYHKPKTLFVARFMGSPQMNTFAVKTADQGGAVGCTLPGGKTHDARQRQRGGRRQRGLRHPARAYGTSERGRTLRPHHPGGKARLGDDGACRYWRRSADHREGRWIDGRENRRCGILPHQSARLPFVLE